jgi:hypothetical protein
MKQRDALEKSIQKWLKIARGTGVDKGADNCALCAMYLKHDKCSPKCPVMRATGIQDCANTPYVEWSDCFSEDAWMEMDRNITNAFDRERAQNAAYAMAGFLVSLRKKP